MPGALRSLALVAFLGGPPALAIQAPDPAELSRRGTELMAAGRYAALRQGHLQTLDGA